MRNFTLIFIAFSSRRFAFPALRISAPFRIITPLRRRTADSTVRYFAFTHLYGHCQGPSLLRLHLTRQRYSEASQSFLFLCGETLFISFALRSMLYNARTEQFLYFSALFYALTVQIHCITCLCHVSSKLCFAQTIQDLALSPLHDAFTYKYPAMPLQVESVPLLSQSAP